MFYVVIYIYHVSTVPSIFRVFFLEIFPAVSYILTIALCIAFRNLLWGGNVLSCNAQ